MKFVDYQILPAIKGNLQQMGLLRPTDIQYKAIPSILKGEDVLAIAQTGTGKTAAFAVPIVHLLGSRPQKPAHKFIRCIVLAPTHELAEQITDVFHTIARDTPVKALCLIGGVDQDPQIAALKAGIDILVATPGRMFDLHHQGHLKLDRIEMLVLDEADHMLDRGFLKDIQDLSRHLPRRRQTLFFSATLDQRIKKIAYSLVRNAIRIQISPKNPVAKNIEHSVAFIEMDDKRFFLERLIRENPGSKFITFVRTIVRAGRVAAAMERVDIKAETLHREKSEQERSLAIKGFRNGDFNLLVTTDISARGIDIPDIDFVVNYDLPDVAEMYVHRVGRTGRGKKKGLAVSFCSTGEKPILGEIESFLQDKINVLKVHSKDVDTTRQLAQENLIKDKEDDWRSLMDEAREVMGDVKKKKRKPEKKKRKKKKK